MIRIGVLGYGYWGPNLVRNFMRTAGCSVVRVADLEPRRLQVLQRDWPGIQATCTPEEVTRAEDIDAVIVATPIRTHYELAMDALQHGKHVLVEKPLAHSVALCERLMAEAERRKRVLMVDHTFLYTEALRWMRDFVDSGQLGQMYYLDAVRMNLGLFQSDASVIWDLAPHDLSILFALSGRRPLSVTATGSCHAGSRVPNIAYLSLDLGGDAMAHIHVNWLSPVKVRRTVLTGSERMVVFDDLENSEKIKVYDSGAFVEHNNIAGQHRIRVDYRTGDMTSPALTHREALASLAEHFAQCITYGEQPRTGGEEGLQVVRVLEAAHRSLECGGQRVRL